MVPLILRRMPLALAVALGGGWVAGCAGSGSFEGGVYRGSEVSYALPSPADGWRPIEVQERRNDVAWSHPELASIIQVNSSCNPELDIPLEALANHLVIGFTEREYKSEERVPMAAREALRIHLVAKLDGVPREMIFHVLKKNGCVWDFAVISPPDERFARAERDYERMLRGFETRERDR